MPDEMETIQGYVCRIEMLRRETSRDEPFYGSAELFKTLGDPTRNRILYCLKDYELCVCDLAEILGMTHSSISHQLRILRANRLVRYRREGRKVYYSLDDQHVKSLLEQSFEHVSEMS